MKKKEPALLLNKGKDSNLRKTLNVLAKKADDIRVAAAFFTDWELISLWKGRKVTLVVGLRPPTSYESLANLMPAEYVSLHFLGREFHSKVWVFMKDGQPFSAVVGSSNCTANGLVHNMETNVLVKESKMLQQLLVHFDDDILHRASVLQPRDLELYKKVCEQWAAANAAVAESLKQMDHQLQAHARKKPTSGKVGKTARDYLRFWKCVDDVRLLTAPQLQAHTKGHMAYLVLDNFFYWVVATWDSADTGSISYHQRKKTVPALFKKYLSREISSEYDALWREKRSKVVFQKTLNGADIGQLTKAQARVIYSSLHSSYMQNQRFDGEHKFAANSISRIRKSLSYLLHSPDTIDVRIHRMLTDPSLKLATLGASGVLELNGWMFPDRYPICNDKARQALRLLGYTP